MAVFLALENGARDTAVLEKAGADETSRAGLIVLIFKLSTFRERQSLPPMIAIFGEAIVGDVLLE